MEKESFIQMKKMLLLLLTVLVGGISASEDGDWNPSLLRVGDVLKISVFRVEEFSSVVRIDDDGKFSYPLSGRIQAAGLTTREVAKNLTRLLSDQVSNPSVDVSVTEFGPRPVFILGELKGGSKSFELPPFERMSALQLISHAGGFTDNADQTKVVVLRRVKGQKKPKRIPVDLLLLYGRDNKEGEFYLLPEDVMVVPKARPVSVSGFVQTPGLYQIDTMAPPLCSEFMVRAGGMIAGADPANIRIVRSSSSGEERKVISASLKIMPDGEYEKDVRILAGDYILVSKGPQIYVVGEVNKPGPLSLLPNQKITASQAVALAGGFTSVAKQGALVLIRDKDRKNVNLNHLYSRPDQMKNDVELQLGDILFVPQSFW